MVTDSFRVRLLSGNIATVTFLPFAALTRLFANPRNWTSRTSPADTLLMVNWPFELVVVPFDVPTTITNAPERGSPPSSTTVPETEKRAPSSCATVVNESAGRRSAINVAMISLIFIRLFCY